MEALLILSVALGLLWHLLPWLFVGAGVFAILLACIAWDRRRRTVNAAGTTTTRPSRRKRPARPRR